MAKKADEADPGGGLMLLQNSYPALAGGGAVAEAMAVNLGGEEVTMFDLERIKLPSGGALQYVIPQSDGDEGYEKELTGIVVYTKIGRTFWRTAFENRDGAATPPDCSSPDGIQGYGDPGIKCAECAYAQFGSRAAVDEGREPTSEDFKHKSAPACARQRFMFLLREGSSLPSVLILPPTSLDAIKKWLVDISRQGVPYWGVITKLTLAKAVNSAGVPYAQARAGVVRKLTPDEVVKVQEFAIQTRDTFAQFREGQAATAEPMDA